MNLTVGNRQIKGVELLAFKDGHLPSDDKSIAKRQTDGVNVVDAAGNRYYMHKRCLVDLDKFHAPPGTAITVDGKAHKTASPVVDWGDSLLMRGLSHAIAFVARIVTWFGR